MKNKSVDMLSCNITRGLLYLSIPIMIMNVAQSLFGLLDIAVLKAFGFESEVGAVGACGVLITLCTSLLIGIAAGSNVVVARHVGAGEKRKAELSITTALIFSVIGGILLLIVGAVFARDFLVLTNCHYTLLDDAALYFRIYFYGSPILMLYNFAAALLRALGDTKRPMYYLFVGCICKIILTIAFILLTGRAIESVAIATVISNFISCILSVFALIKNKSIVDVNFGKLRFDFNELKSILYNGIPAGLQSAMYSFANVIITSTVNSFGPDATTGISIANQYDGILYQISYSPSLAVVPFIAQNMGAGNYKRVKKVLGSGILITVAFGASLGILTAIFASDLSYLISSSPSVVSYSVQKMTLVSSTYFICGINEVMGGTLKGMGKPMAPTIASFLFMCLLRFVWVYIVFPCNPDLTFLYLVWPIGWVLSILTLVFAFSFAISKYKRTELQKTEASA